MALPPRRDAASGLPGATTPVDPGLMSRVIDGLRYMVTGAPPLVAWPPAWTEAWFGPGTPLQPMAPEATAGRQFDYPFAYNTLINRPRSEEPLGFEQLRALADSYDLLRLVIETRKDQVARLTWYLADHSGKPIAAADNPRAGAILDLLACPDREHGWAEWLRMLLEDMLVLDAATLYPRRTLGGSVYALEVIDGATIRRLIDERGRTPEAPAPAYQQILKGLPAVDYSRDELLYLPRNVRSHRVYGLSPVEQVVMSVNIALRRQVHQLSYYTEGATPDLVFGVPETWQPGQIAEFEEYWNGLLAGNLGERRRARFIPGGVKPFDTKEQALKDDYDEWLARIVCYAFSVSPHPFVRDQTRATAVTNQSAALAEGLLPVAEWVRSLMNRLLATVLGAPDLTFVWNPDTSNAAEQATIDVAYVGAGILTADEVRARLGLPPLGESAAPSPRKAS